MKRRFIVPGVVAGLVALLGAYGCDQPDPNNLTGDLGQSTDCPPTTGSGQTATTATTGGQGASSGSSGSGAGGPGVTELDDRELDYNEALRTASLKLVGNLPRVDDIYALAQTPDPQKADKYAEMVDAMMADPRFAVRMLEYYRGVFKMEGDGTKPGHPSRETAPTFAARIMVEGRNWKETLLATQDTCPSYDADTNTFIPGECNNGITPAGVLTDPGIYSLFWGNLAFRRNRFFHETFLCRSGNADGGPEPTDNPSKVGPSGADDAPANYNSPWPMNSIVGDYTSDLPGGHEVVNFHAYNATTICANCHGTWNHRAPLFAPFDDNGMYVDPAVAGFYQVLVPVDGSPNAIRTDWLPDSEGFAWKYNMPVTDLANLGEVMVGDPEVINCAVKRTWNYAMSRGDIVDNNTPVPNKVIKKLAEDFVANNYNMRQTLRDILVSDDFVRF